MFKIFAQAWERKEKGVDVTTTEMLQSILQTQIKEVHWE